MELFHNQVTKGQGVASFRFQHRSFGLYFIAANIDADVTVLDFPSKKRFIRELKNGYDAVGISFIAPNFPKAREMARLTREHTLNSTIILGGHGAAIEGVDELIDCDHVAKGEGIRWMRDFLGQDVNAPLVHPALPSTEHQSIYGVPVPGPTASLLVTGVGCVNACSFCCTSHFFGKSYTPFIGGGRELFETAERIADMSGSNVFFIMDENFLKDRERALELIDEMKRHQRFFEFHVFSSAEALTAFGVDNLVRLGAQFVWIGFESQSQQDKFAKNKGIDPSALVKQMRDAGISVLASGILCMEHHTPDNIGKDIEFLVGLNADMVQFMLLTPMHVTALYRDMKARGLYRDDIPFEEVHGQKLLNWHHPAFDEGEPEQWLNRAFQRDYEENSSSMFRVIDTSLRGYRALKALPKRDPCHQARMEQFERRAREYRSMLPSISRYPANLAERHRAAQMDRAMTEAFGKPTFKERLFRIVALTMTASWKIRLKVKGDAMQPRTIVTHYTTKSRNQSDSGIPLTNLAPIVRKIEEVQSKTAAAMVSTVPPLSKHGIFFSGP